MMHSPPKASFQDADVPRPPVSGIDVVTTLAHFAIVTYTVRPFFKMHFGQTNYRAVLKQALRLPSRARAEIARSDLSTRLAANVRSPSHHAIRRGFVPQTSRLGR